MRHGPHESYAGEEADRCYEVKEESDEQKSSAVSDNTAAIEAMSMKCSQCGWTQPVLNAGVGSGLVFYECYCLECGGQVFEIAEQRQACWAFIVN